MGSSTCPLCGSKDTSIAIETKTECGKAYEINLTLRCHECLSTISYSGTTTRAHDFVSILNLSNFRKENTND